MTPTAQTQAAATFASFWAGRGDEKQETSRFWIDLLQNVLGIDNPAKYIEFEKRVKLSHTSFVDAYIPDTKVLIEQKGAKIDLHKKYAQSDGEELTPYEQAKRYADEMPNSLRPRWIVVCNFQEFLVYDLEKPHTEPEQIYLKDLEKEYYRLQFLADARHDYLRREEELSLQAGVLVGKLYDALIKQYINPKDEQSLRSLNILCVRLVFCLYAEDAGLFSTRTAFEDYIHSFSIENTRKALIDLFKALDTKLENRDRYDTKLTAFPYVNGGLFAAENIEIPNFTDEIVDVLCNHCAPFNWSDISPTIFGAVFESTLNPETRRKGGMHYTSVQNIHKAIDPLFMDDLNAEFQAIMGSGTETRRATSLRERNQKLHDFQKKLGSLTFLDPACGSGNFLTETYVSLRRLENKVISALNKGEKVIGFEDFIHVKINQFYGIEINDFAVTVAKTALWIAESQMMAETEKILGMNLNFFPLTTNASIVEGNALRMDWATLQPYDTDKGACPLAEVNEPNLFSGFTTQTDGTAHHYDYIIGNPPFVGYSYQTKEQKSDLQLVMPEFGSNIDYVAGWYVKAAKLIQYTDTRCALVSTNSITQGEQVAILWKPLFEKFNIQIDFAWRTFRWDSESNQKAHVHCVIIGFREAKIPSSRNKEVKILSSHNISEVGNFTSMCASMYLDKNQDVNEHRAHLPHWHQDGKLQFITFRLADSLPQEKLDELEQNKERFMQQHLQPWDKETEAQYYKLFGSKIDEWLDAGMGSCLLKFPNIRKIVCDALSFFDGDRYRLHSYVVMPNHVHVLVELLGENKTGDVLHSWKRHTANQINKLIGGSGKFWQHESFDRIIRDKEHYNNVLRYIANNPRNLPEDSFSIYMGEKISSSHSCEVGNFASMEDKISSSHDCDVKNVASLREVGNFASMIEQTAQAILDARALYPDSSLADLYDPVLMPVELRRAHQKNDEAVLAAYG